VVTDSVPNTASATATVTVGSSAGFKVEVDIPFDTPSQVSVTVGNNVCLASVTFFPDRPPLQTTCAQQVPSGTQVLLTVVKFPPGSTKLSGWNGVTCDTTTPTTCTFTVTKDTFAIPIFLWDCGRRLPRGRLLGGAWRTPPCTVTVAADSVYSLPAASITTIRGKV